MDSPPSPVFLLSGGSLWSCKQWCTWESQTDMWDTDRPLPQLMSLVHRRKNTGVIMTAAFQLADPAFVDQSQFQPAVLQWTATNNRCSLTGRSDEGYWFESMLRGWYLSLRLLFLFIKLFWDKLLLPPADWFQVLQVWILLMVQSEKNWSQNSFKCLLAQKHNLTSKVKYCDVKVELQRTVVISRPLSCD